MHSVLKAVITQESLHLLHPGRMGACGLDQASCGKEAQKPGSVIQNTPTISPFAPIPHEKGRFRTSIFP